MKFLRFLKKEKKPRPDPAADGKRRQMEALISAAASIQNYSFNGQARHFLTARHGRRVRIPALTLYYEADGMWLTALKLARELGDTVREIALGLFMTRAFRETGKLEDAARSREDMRSSLDRASARGVPIPDWLRQEAGWELVDPVVNRDAIEAETGKTK